MPAWTSCRSTCLLKRWYTMQLSGSPHSHASVNISHYKCISICAKVAHIVYQPISAKIYLLAAYSALAQKYHVHYMRVGQHIFCLALCIPANIYAGALLAIQPTYIISHI